MRHFWIFLSIFETAAQKFLNNFELAWQKFESYRPLRAQNLDLLSLVIILLLIASEETHR